jgi:hypothetical protein
MRVNGTWQRKKKKYNSWKAKEEYENDRQRT